MHLCCPCLPRLHRALGDGRGQEHQQVPLPGWSARAVRLGNASELPSWSPGGMVPVSGVGWPVRSAHICQKRSLWCGRTNMLNPAGGRGGRGGRCSGPAPSRVPFPEPLQGPSETCSAAGASPQASRWSALPPQPPPSRSCHPVCRWSVLLGAACSPQPPGPCGHPPGRCSRQAGLASGPAERRAPFVHRGQRLLGRERLRRPRAPRRLLPPRASALLLALVRASSGPCTFGWGPGGQVRLAAVQVPSSVQLPGRTLGQGHLGDRLPPS